MPQDFFGSHGEGGTENPQALFCLGYFHPKPLHFLFKGSSFSLIFHVMALCPFSPLRVRRYVVYHSWDWTCTLPLRKIYLKQGQNNQSDSAGNQQNSQETDETSHLLQVQTNQTAFFEEFVSRIVPTAPAGIWRFFLTNEHQRNRHTQTMNQNFFKTTFISGFRVCKNGPQVFIGSGSTFLSVQFWWIDLR